MNFVKYRYVSFCLALFFVLSTLISMFTPGIKYGIDFKGGYILEVSTQAEPNLPELRSSLENLNIGSVSIQQIGAQKKDIMIKMERKNDDDAGDEGLRKIKEILGTQTEYKKIETVGPKVGAELIRSATKAVIIALCLMMVYIVVRFQWQYALSGILALLHDCIVIMSLFTIFGFDFNESAIVGILTIAGYSINDTIVVFDRIRENIARKPNLSMEDIINSSINETLSRTVFTVATTMLALCAMYFFGGKVIALFSIPIIFGILLGTFSSIFVAAPLLLFLGFKKKIHTSQS